MAPLRKPRSVVGDDVCDGRNEVDAVVVGVYVDESVCEIGVACDHLGAGAWVEGWDASMLVYELYESGFGGGCSSREGGW